MQSSNKSYGYIAKIINLSKNTGQTITRDLKKNSSVLNKIRSDGSNLKAIQEQVFHNYGLIIFKLLVMNKLYGELYMLKVCIENSKKKIINL